MAFLSILKTTAILFLVTGSLATDSSKCWSYQGDGVDVAADTGGTASKRSIAGRLDVPQQLAERSANDRNFDAFKDGNDKVICKLDKVLKVPSYPGPSALNKYISKGAEAWWVMTEVSEANTCPIMGYKKVSDSEVTSQKIRSTDESYRKGGYWKEGKPALNVDHVYELTILKQFFQSRLTTANCAEFKKYFDVADNGSPSVKGDTRLQTIWRQLPSSTNPDFAGMDSKINSVKAQIFTGNFQNPKTSNDSLAYVWEMALATKLTNDDMVAPLFKKTNIRIYEALLGMDVAIAAQNSKITGTKLIQPDWASSYKTWMTKYLETQNAAVIKKVGEILKNDKQLGPKVQSATKTISQGVAALLDAYPTPNSFTLDAAKLLAFPQTTTLNIKREESTILPQPTLPVMHYTAPTVTAKATLLS